MESLVLSPQDVENLEAMSDGSTGYFYKMLDYLEKRVEDGVRRGRFSEEAAKADLETALWYSYACNNLDEYESYCRAAQWMAASEGSAEAARCGMWYYRYSCALLYCGRLEEALAYAEKGVAVEPDYVWGWLQLGKLRSHFGDTAGAWPPVERGLALEPGDYEFTTLARETGRAGAWRRWSTTGSTRSRTGGSRPERRRRGRWRTNAWPSPVSSATGPIWRPSRRPWA